MERTGWTYLIGGVLLAFAGANLAAWGNPSAGRDPFHIFLVTGCLAIVAGSTLIRMARRRLHHTATDPIAVGLILLGIAALLLVKFLVAPQWSIFGASNFAVALLLGGSLLARNRQKGM
jgi:drug/metabolite transporter (DMT)-like permease